MVNENYSHTPKLAVNGSIIRPISRSLITRLKIKILQGLFRRERTSVNDNKTRQLANVVKIAMNIRMVPKIKCSIGKK